MIVAAGTRKFKARELPVRFTAPGTFEFHCDVFCGSGHEEMSGRFEVS